VLRQPIGNVMVVRDRRVDAIAVERRAPLHPALVAARTDERIPDELAGPGVEQRVDAALAADADDVAAVSLDETPAPVVIVAAPVPIDANLEAVRAGAAEIPLLPVGFRRTPGDARRQAAA